MRAKALLTLIVVCAILEAGAVFFAVAVLARPHTAGETFSVCLAVIAPLIALIGCIATYRRVKRLAPSA